jgi:hypothetical protein
LEVTVERKPRPETPGNYKRTDFLRDLKKASKKLAPKPSARSPRKPGT